MPSKNSLRGSNFERELVNTARAAGFRAERAWKERFWAKVDKTEGCWLWIAGKDQDGYGVTSRKRISFRAHRVSYEWAYGPIPDGLMVCHTCDNPSCVNPAHLYAGTDAQNKRDMYDRGRQPRHESHGRAKITYEIATRIRLLVRNGKTKTEVAEQYGLGITTVGHIIHGRTWKDA